MLAKLGARYRQMKLTRDIHPLELRSPLLILTALFPGDGRRTQITWLEHPVLIFPNQRSRMQHTLS